MLFHVNSICEPRLKIELSPVPVSVASGEQ